MGLEKVKIHKWPPARIQLTNADGWHLSVHDPGTVWMSGWILSLTIWGYWTVYILPAAVHRFQFGVSKWGVLGRNYTEELWVGLTPFIFAEKTNPIHLECFTINFKYWYKYDTQMLSVNSSDHWTNLKIIVKVKTKQKV